MLAWVPEIQTNILEALVALAHAVGARARAALDGQQAATEADLVPMLECLEEALNVHNAFHSKHKYDPLPHRLASLDRVSIVAPYEVEDPVVRRARTPQTLDTNNAGARSPAGQEEHGVTVHRPLVVYAWYTFVANEVAHGAADALLGVRAPLPLPPTPLTSYASAARQCAGDGHLAHAGRVLEGPGQGASTRARAAVPSPVPHPGAPRPRPASATPSTSSATGR